MPLEEKIELVLREDKLVMLDPAENFIIIFPEMFKGEWESEQIVQLNDDFKKSLKYLAIISIFNKSC